MTAARIVDPVARPSSTRITVLLVSDSGPAVAAIRVFPPFELALLAFGHGIDHIAGNAEGIDDVAIDQADAAGGDGTHGELFVPGHAELAHDVDVERDAERPGDFARDGHAAARQRQHDHVVPIAIIGQLSEPAARRPRPDHEMAVKTLVACWAHPVVLLDRCHFDSLRSGH